MGSHASRVHCWHTTHCRRSYTMRPQAAAAVYAVYTTDELMRVSNSDSITARERERDRNPDEVTESSLRVHYRCSHISHTPSNVLSPRPVPPRPVCSQPQFLRTPTAACAATFRGWQSCGRRCSASRSCWRRSARSSPVEVPRPPYSRRAGGRRRAWRRRRRAPFSRRP